LLEAGRWNGRTDKEGSVKRGDRENVKKKKKKKKRKKKRIEKAGKAIKQRKTNIKEKEQVQFDGTVLLSLRWNGRSRKSAD